MQAPELLNTFIQPLEQAGIPYFITGSIAAIFYGEPRLTHDVDLVVMLGKGQSSSLACLYDKDEFYCPPADVIEIERERKPYGHFNVIHHRSGFKADIYIDADDKLHALAFKKRKRVELGDDLSVWIAPPEYVIIRKLEYFREGGSTKHIEDIRKMLLQIIQSIDNETLQEQLRLRGLKEIWNTHFTD